MQKSFLLVLLLVVVAVIEAHIHFSQLLADSLGLTYRSALWSPSKTYPQAGHGQKLLSN